jgi:tetratricopeptide (TPR) repeat protein
VIDCAQNVDPGVRPTRATCASRIRPRRLVAAFLPLLLLPLLLLHAGCASPRSDYSWPRTGDPLVDGRTAIEQGPPRDRVLWQYRTAAVALRAGHFDEARELLDDALATLGGIHGPDRDARRARRLFSAEARKTFVGEPYERVMAYYYRGILYWMEGEPDNARACFRSAQFMDSDAINREYASDYLLLEYLEALATAKLGGDPSDALARAQSLTRLAPPPPLNPEANLLFFVELGRGPTKYATGPYREQLRFLPGRAAAGSVRIRAGNQSVEARPHDDLTFQATTRGGRVMDHILANQAVFKEATDTAGDVAIISGAIMASHQGQQSPVDEIGLGLIAAGVLSKILSAATNPSADTRSWQNLPNYLSFAKLQVPPGSHDLTFEFLGRDGRLLSDRTQSVTVRVEEGQDTVVFVSDIN